ncbi:MAG: hypothetical protein HW390_2400 [Candidatus Brocadiaceae bacterium]|nr:hypothetical protein [Candidatus Brocadiaceae bacterium]
MKQTGRYTGKIRAYFKTIHVFIFLSLFLAVAPLCNGDSKASPSEAKEDAFLVLGREQSLAESYAYMLNEFGKNDLNTYARGIELYVAARAEFNGLIEYMKTKLIKAEPFNTSSDFQEIIKKAVDSRISFTAFIKEEILSKHVGEKGVVTDIIKSAGELITAITGVGKTVWLEYRAVKDSQKKELLDQLNALKWKEFHQIGGGK